MTLQAILAILISVAIPAIFLTIIYTLDLYASRTFRIVLISFAWGAIGAFGLSLLINTWGGDFLIASAGLTYAALTILMAPVVEEIAKSLSLFYVSRRREFTYFVDGAIYGFAAGIGFSIFENILYITQNPDVAVPLALVRAFSTCLMHGTAAGLVGTAVGWLRLRRRAFRRWALILGWIVAMGLHSSFNAVAWFSAQPDHPLARGSLGTLIAVVIGLTGVGSIALFIILGLREERKWMVETLNRQVGVSAAEVRAVQAYGDIDETLEYIAHQFPHQAEQVEALLLRQAQLGIKRKVRKQIDDAGLREHLGEDIDRLQAEMEDLRGQIGPYIMAYVRSVFPEGALNVWSHLELHALRSEPADLQQWVRRLTPDEGRTSTRSLFDHIQQGTREAQTRGKGEERQGV